MKKSVGFALVAVLMAASLVMFAACPSDTKSDGKFEVKVVGGVINMEDEGVPAGTTTWRFTPEVDQIYILANAAPKGQTFTGWAWKPPEVVVPQPSAQFCSFEMPALDVTFTAQFASDGSDDGDEGTDYISLSHAQEPDKIENGVVTETHPENCRIGQQQWSQIRGKTAGFVRITTNSKYTWGQYNLNNAGSKNWGENLEGITFGSGPYVDFEIQTFLYGTDNNGKLGPNFGFYNMGFCNLALFFGDGANSVIDARYYSTDKYKTKP
jgi:hypothetical protein